MTDHEYRDRRKAEALEQGTAMDAFVAALVAAKALMVTGAASTAADGSAAAGTKTDVAAAGVAIAALSTASIQAFCHY